MVFGEKLSPPFPATTMCTFSGEGVARAVEVVPADEVDCAPTNTSEASAEMIEEGRILKLEVCEIAIIC